jgi:putative tricarboxylic transport membrane protein
MVLGGIMEVKLRSAMPRLKTPLDMIDRPIAAILFGLIILVLALHVRTLVKEWRAHQPEEDHDLHDSQTR